MRPLLILAACGLVAGCMDTTTASAPTAAQMADDAGAAVTTEAAFRSAIVGKTLTFNDNTFTVNGDGTFSGPWDGSGISGRWTWENGAFCRSGRVGSRELERDCQTWVVNGNVATVTRDRGAGGSFDYTIS